MRNAKLWKIIDQFQKYHTILKQLMQLRTCNLTKQVFWFIQSKKNFYRAEQKGFEGEHWQRQYSQELRVFMWIDVCEFYQPGGWKSILVGSFVQQRDHSNHSWEEPLRQGVWSICCMFSPIWRDQVFGSFGSSFLSPIGFIWMDIDIFSLRNQGVDQPFWYKLFSTEGVWPSLPEFCLVFLFDAHPQVFLICGVTSV